mgnify:CR=1 FL=1
MNELERTTFSDGFYICLLETFYNKTNSKTTFKVQLFNGGREIERINAKEDCPYDKETLLKLAEILYKTIAPPNVTAIFGPKCFELIKTVCGDRLSLLRILDIRATAVALKPELPARADIDKILSAYQIPHVEYVPSVSSDAIEQLLWKIISIAGSMQMEWDLLLSLPLEKRHQPDFSSCSFTKETLEMLPEKPGVYMMYDIQNRLLYAGKSANLRRRLADYFHSSVRLTEKEQSIRQQIHSINFKIVGSELEALLNENKMIVENNPIINVQTKIKEDKNKYNEHLLPILILETSAKDNTAELFMFESKKPAYQLSVSINTASPPPAFLKLINFFTGKNSYPAITRKLKNWGMEGSTICLRFFRKNKEKLNWIEITQNLATKESWNKLRKTFRTSHFKETPGEYRYI